MMPNKQGRETGGRGWGVAIHLNFGRGVECLSTPPDFEKIFLTAHICYYVQVISIWEVDSP